jgi:hypothetical protein
MIYTLFSVTNASIFTSDIYNLFHNKSYNLQNVPLPYIAKLAVSVLILSPVKFSAHKN